MSDLAPQPSAAFLDDPRLTAFALGELSRDEAAEIEALLANSPEGREYVAEIRRLGELLTERLQAESSDVLTPDQRAAIAAAAESSAELSIVVRSSPKRRRIAGWLVATGTGVAALAVAVAFLFAPPGRVHTGDNRMAHTAVNAETMEVTFSGEQREPSSYYLEDDVRFFSSGPESITAPARHGDLGHRSDLTARMIQEQLSGGAATPTPVESAPTSMPETREPLSATNPRPDVASMGSASASVKQPASEFARPPGVPPAGKPLPREPNDNYPKYGTIVGLTEQKPGDETVEGSGPYRTGLLPSQPGNEDYSRIVEKPFVSPLDVPLSTFGIDVDTASYANVRRFLTHQQWPPRDAVRIEELVNYFPYDYAPPADEEAPFAAHVETGSCPWALGHRLVRIGLKGKEIDPAARPASNLVFLIDVSGSMSGNNKLPLVRNSLELLVEQLGEGDHVAIVTYSNTAKLVLDAMPVDNNRGTILNAIRGLSAGGSTNGAGGIQLAYETAVRHFLDRGSNRVILCTDGDFNVGISDDDELVRFIEEKAQSSVFLSIFGFGMGNLKDGKLEKLADRGNGHYGYIDTLREAQKSFVEDLSGTLVTIAKDVKIQVEFNPARVGQYRLIGYENRALAPQDFENDQRDAGDIGAGHTVTALYEIIPPGREPAGDAEGTGLKYQRPKREIDPEGSDELLTVKIRYKQPDADRSQLLEFPLVDQAGHRQLSRDFQWACAVASFGRLLRDAGPSSHASFELVEELAQAARGEDPGGHRREFVELVGQAKQIWARHHGITLPQPVAVGDDPITRASVGGKYGRLLRTLQVPTDAQSYGRFHEYGWYTGDDYAGHQDLPDGYWVYVEPHWYIWGTGPKRQ